MLYRGPLPLRAAGYSTDPEGHSWSYFLFTLPLATYHCQKCSFTWSQDPKPLICPRWYCGYIYVDWMNFADWESVKTAVDAEGGPTGLGHQLDSPRRPQ